MSIQQHDHDDGLVHGHAWAMEKPRPAQGGMNGRSIAEAMGTHPEEPTTYDDGLVHAHNWACGERGRMSGR
ncbi:hypothetical protein [Crenalkalicoccus roseus]|uniref:hypothetical protein n=1 Tax=Crenalkalicoccus roseus TaxID=1485588 RepID=UPI00108074D5|nr:hypothetical protein [Crenalkalicoccus roseus]